MLAVYRARASAARVQIPAHSPVSQPRALPKNGSILWQSKLHHRRIRVQNWGGFYTILYYILPYHTILNHTSPELGILFLGSSQGSGKVRMSLREGTPPEDSGRATAESGLRGHRHTFKHHVTRQRARALEKTLALSIEPASCLGSPIGGF